MNFILSYPALFHFDCDLISKLKVMTQQLVSIYRIGFQPSNSNSTSVSSVHHNSTLSLVLFNLEPLTDSLEVLTLRGNLLQSLPMQFRGRNFSRLRKLDLSYNSLNGKCQLKIFFYFFHLKFSISISIKQCQVFQV
jgi:hypothetical protein